MRTLAFLMAILASASLASQKVRFDNNSVYRVIPKNQEQLQSLRSLEDVSGYNFWTDVGTIDTPVDVMVPPDLKAGFKNVLDSDGIPSETLIEDVQELVESSESNTGESFRSMDWTNYHTLEEIYDWLGELANTYPNNVRLLNVGKSYENRDIKGVHVSFSPENANGAVFVEGGIHAREWISPATVTYILNEFLSSSNATIQNIARSFDWYFFPVFNPDGYTFTFTTNRLWRKTRIPYLNCYGADPNRNWGAFWGQGGSSSNPCSGNYRGPSAFSENSTRALSNYIATIAERLFGYISFHSYSQRLLIPYGHTIEHLDNYDELKEIGDKAAVSLASRYGTQYKVGTFAETLYIGSGLSVDWSKHNFGTRITYTYELRDKGKFGFLLPPEQIIPTGLETLDSFITIFQEALALLKKDN